MAFVGGAATDEPRAAVVARDVLAAGGSAVDAVAAAYFALSVTMPSSASLGGGGVCLVFDARLGRIEAVDFMARPGAGLPTPMNARGIFVMQGRYGRARWEQIVAPAEGLARFGVPVSRALARDLAENAGVIAQSHELSRLFRPKGVLLKEGDQLVQPALADTLGVIRARGAKEFHDGSEAAGFVAAARAAGAGFTPAEFAAAAPQFRAPLTVNAGDARIAFAPPPASIGVYQAQLVQMLAPRWTTVPRDEQAHLLIEAQTRALTDGQRWNALDLADFAMVGDTISAPRAARLLADYRAQQATAATGGAAIVEDTATTTVVAADREGGAVSCAFTAGGPFGSGRVAKGVILAAPSQAGGRGVTSLAPMLAVRSYGGGFSLSPRANTAQLVFAGAAGGGNGAAAALAAVAMTTLVERRPLDEALDRPRLSVTGGDGVRAEPGAAARYPGLGQRGHRLIETPAIGRLNAIVCTEGLIDEPTSCRVRSDARGHGLAVGGVR